MLQARRPIPHRQLRKVLLPESQKARRPRFMETGSAQAAQVNMNIIIFSGDEFVYGSDCRTETTGRGTKMSNHPTLFLSESLRTSAKPCSPLVVALMVRLGLSVRKFRHGSSCLGASLQRTKQDTEAQLATIVHDLPPPGKTVVGPCTQKRKLWTRIDRGILARLANEPQNKASLSDSCDHASSRWNTQAVLPIDHPE